MKGIQLLIVNILVVLYK